MRSQQGKCDVLSSTICSKIWVYSIKTGKIKEIRVFDYVWGRECYWRFRLYVCGGGFTQHKQNLLLAAKGCDSVILFLTVSESAINMTKYGSRPSRAEKSTTKGFRQIWISNFSNKSVCNLFKLLLHCARAGRSMVWTSCDTEEDESTKSSREMSHSCGSLSGTDIKVTRTARHRTLQVRITSSRSCASCCIMESINEFRMVSWKYIQFYFEYIREKGSYTTSLPWKSLPVELFNTTLYKKATRLNISFI